LLSRKALNMEKNTDYFTFYNQLPKELELTYPDLNFKDHCYLRIALDNAIGTRWDIRVAKPAYKNLDNEQRHQVLANLAEYTRDKSTLLEHNAISLAYRGKLG